MTIKKIWLYIAGLFAILVGAFMFERKQKDEAEVKASIAEDGTKEAALKQQDIDNEASAAQEQARVEALQKSLVTTQVQQMTPEQVKAYWDSKK